MSNTNSCKSHKFAKLCIITQFYPPDYAATGQLIEELANQLGEMGFAVDIFTGQPGYAFDQESAPARENLGAVSVQRSRSTRIWAKRLRGKAISGILFCLRAGLHLLKILLTRDKKTAGSNVLIVTTAPPFLPILGYLANLCFNLPYICVLYDIYPDIAVELKVVSAQSWLVRGWNLINRVIWKRALQVVVLSDSMKNRVAAKCPEIADKIVVIPTWADPNLIVPIPKKQNWFAQQFNIVDKFTVLYSGNMGRCHDLETILETATSLRSEPIQFVFIGNGANRPAFIEKVKDLGLENCLFLPYQDKKNLPYSLTACDLSLVSIKSGMEGLVVPSKFYSALATGLPVAVISGSNTDLYQLVKKAKCGGAFTNGNSSGLANFIRYLAADREVAQQMGNSGRSYLQENFTLEIVAKKYAQILCSPNLEPINVGELAKDPKYVQET
jgi:glycosyltransferase involved in cell wall biosynthesis